MDNIMDKKYVPCQICNKPVLVSDMRDVRSATPMYCSRVCESNKRYVGMRYRDAGASQKPTVQEMLEKK